MHVTDWRNPGLDLVGSKVMSRKFFSLLVSAAVVSATFAGGALANDAQEARKSEIGLQFAGASVSGGNAHKIVGTGVNSNKIVGTGVNSNKIVGTGVNSNKI